MLPEQPISYPEFVADQLLTANNLNDLFNYLDEQERGTRINLIGIGIVCGLELWVNSAGTSITISKGCGITSAGYLVRWDEATFENYIAYDAAQELVYTPQFVSAGKQKFSIDELKSDSSEEDLTKLDSTYLADKVVLLFVELLEVNAKNCDPESCDDKGKNVTLTIRPLVVEKKSAVYLTGGVAGSSSFTQTWLSLPEIRIPRHHLPAADIFDTGDVFQGFQNVMSPAFLKDLENKLGQTYSRISPLVKDIYSSNPFTGMAADYAFITDGTMTAEQMLYLQYYYDLFSDIIYAYRELRSVGMNLMSLCCPDEGLFPRHLLLGTASSTVNDVKSDFRQYFIPSPAVCCHGSLVGELRLLFKRIVLLLEKFNPQSAQQFQSTTSAFTNVNAARAAGSAVPIRVTPSRFGDVPLSVKSIPFYYNVTGGTEKLLQHWNYRLSAMGAASKNLSYHAVEYFNGDDAVLNPLHYDLEPYNFLRIEGHVGHGYVDALATINNIRDTNRLPFDVVALSADIITLRDQLASIAGSVSNSGLTNGLQADISMLCHFQDLEAQYDVLAQGLLCNLCKEMRYYYNPPSSTDDTIADKVPAVPLLKKCAPDFRYKANSLGDSFEQFWAKVANQPYMSPDQIVNANFGTTTFGTNENRASNIFNLFFALLYYIEKLSEILPTTLIAFNLATFLRRYNDLMIVAQKIKDVYVALENTSDNNETIQAAMAAEDFLDHLDALLYACKDAQFAALYNDYKTRWVYLAMLQKFGYYVKMHPGIQHKAGVPMGGTFVIVYHERSKVTKPDTTIFTRDTALRATDLKTEDISISSGAIPVEKQADAKMADKSPSPAPGAAAANAQSAAANPDTTQTAASSAKATAQTTAISVTYTGVRQLDINKLKAQLTAQQLSVIDRLFYKPIVVRHSLADLTAQLPDKIVIADFYLPYMCCSDCPPVYFIVNEMTEVDPPVPTIAVKQNQYCSDDKGAYPIDVTPAGGTVSGEGVQTANGVSTFNPSSVVLDSALNKVVQLTYTIDGQSASLNVTVFAKPTANFEIIPATTYSLFVFSNQSQNAASVSWDFGDGITATGDNPSHNYNADGIYIVAVSAVNGICSDTITKTINVAKATISVDGNTFCNADTKTYAITVSPDGGQISGEGVNDTGFMPSSVKLDAGIASKDVNITYSVSGQVAQATVKVFQMPDPTFTVKNSAASGNIKVFSTNNALPAQYSWDFGDGNSSVETNPSHQYAAPGSYIVKLAVTNGPCKGNSSQTVTIIQASVSITPGVFCSADKSSYPVAASPSGGTISGEGTSSSGTSFTFNPSVVVFTPTLPKKTVTIGYAAGGQSAQTQVTVFQTPAANFTVQNATAPNIKTFSTSVQFPVTYSWDFGDGTTDTVPNPTHQYTKGGQLTVTLTVSNGNCTEQSQQTITINIDSPSQKTCGPLTSVIGEFNGLGKINADQFKSFTAVYKSYAVIAKYIPSLQDISTKAVADQISFFQSSNVAGMLNDWFAELNGLVMAGNVRSLALAMWQTLTDLAMYVMCIQDGDFDKDAVNLSDLFKRLEGFINGWIQVIKSFIAGDRNLVVALQSDIAKERDRVQTNGESIIKKNYFAELNTLIDILTTVLK